MYYWNTIYLYRKDLGGSGKTSVYTSVKGYEEPLQIVSSVADRYPCDTLEGRHCFCFLEDWKDD